MLTYARMGQRSEALNQYQLLRTTLREELRVSPLPETVELYRAIHAGRVPVDLTDMRQPLQGVPAGELLDTPVHTHAHAAMDVHSHEALSGVTVKPLEAEGTATARVFWGRSICAGWQDDWERSVELSEEALHIVQRHGELPLVYPYFLLQTAKAYFFIGKIERAQHSLDQAMLFAQEHQYRQLPALGYRLQGRILQVQNKHAEAENYFERSLAGLAALDDAVEYARTQQGIQPVLLR